MTPNPTGLTEPPDAAQRPETGEPTDRTTVSVRACGRFRRRFDDSRFEFTFEGETLRAFVGAFLARHPDVSELLVGETRREDDAGWTDLQDDVGEESRPFVRVMINGTFNEYCGGADAQLADGDRIELVEPLTC
jgi:molybdopterin converting factor small subunit